MMESELSDLCSRYGAVYSDLRFVRSRIQVISSDPRNTNISDTTFSGFGVRVFKSGSLGFSYSTDMTDLGKTFARAVKIARSVGRKDAHLPERNPIKDTYTKSIKIDPFSVEEPEKLAWLNSFKKGLQCKPIKDTHTALLFSKVNTIFADSAGSKVEQTITRSMVGVNVVGAKNETLSSVSFRRSDAAGYELLSDIDIEKESAELKKRLSNRLSAGRAPAGKFTVVCDPKLTGLFFHEAVGHACEADYVLNRASVLCDKREESIASSTVTLLDDPNLRTWGHYKYDDEGTRAKETRLISDGFLTGYLHSRTTAVEMGVEPTSNGRAMSTEVIPIPRMSVLKVEPGDMPVDEMMSMDNVILAKGFTGGEVDLVKGNFIFGCEEAFLIKGGEKIPLRDVAFSGNILETLRNVLGIGKKLQQTYTGGMCGKKGQSVPVSEMMPYMVVSGVYVGGENS